jgi:hypothetical protein
MQILTIENILKLNISSTGIYRIFVCTEDGNPVEIHRLIGVDSRFPNYKKTFLK